MRTDSFKQAGVFNGDSEAAGKQSENALLIGSEIIQAITLNIEDADALALNHERYGEFGTNTVNGVDVTQVLADVTDADRMTGRGRDAGDALAQRYAQIGGQVRWIANGKAML